MQHQDGSQHEIPIGDPALWQPMPSVSRHMKALNVAVQHWSCPHARTNHKHSSSDEYAAVAWLAAARKERGRDAY